MSVSVWIEPNSVSLQQAFFSKQDSFSFKLNNDEITVSFFGQTPQDVTSSNMNLVANELTHIVITYDKSLSSDNLKFYKNGVNVENITYINGFNQNNNDMKIGSNQNGDDFDGLIDEVMLFNRVLSLNGTLALFNSNHNALFEEFTNLPDKINITACGINSEGNYNCSEKREFTVESVAEIKVVKPLNNSVYFQNNSVYVEINSTVDLSNISFYLNSVTSNIYYMNKNDAKNWSYNLINLKPNIYNMTFNYTTSSGKTNSTFWDSFSYLKNSSQVMTKNIKSIGINKYNVSLNILNILFNQSLVIYDFVNSNFTSYNYSLNLGGNNLISGKYNGNLIFWNLNLTNGENITISYIINGSNNFNLVNNNLFGFE